MSMCVYAESTADCFHISDFVAMSPHCWKCELRNVEKANWGGDSGPHETLQCLLDLAICCINIPYYYGIRRGEVSLFDIRDVALEQQHTQFRHGDRLKRHDGRYLTVIGPDRSETERRGKSQGIHSSWWWCRSCFPWGRLLPVWEGWALDRPPRAAKVNYNIIISEGILGTNRQGLPQASSKREGWMVLVASKSQNSGGCWQDLVRVKLGLQAVRPASTSCSPNIQSSSAGVAECSPQSFLGESQWTFHASHSKTWEFKDIWSMFNYHQQRPMWMWQVTALNLSTYIHLWYLTCFSRFLSHLC